MAKTKPNFSLILILLLGLGLRLINLNQSFWLDEASQGQLSSLSLSQIWSGRGGDFHPPLFYLISHFWLQFDRSEIWLRLPSVFFGVANIYLIYLFAQKLFSNLKIKIGHWILNIEHLSAFLLAIAPYHIYYSQEFRSYSLLCLLGTWSMYLFFRQKYLLLALANALLLYTHYSSIFLILTQLIFVLIYRKKEIKLVIGYWLLIIILYLPWLPQLLTQINSGINIDTYLPGWRQVLSINSLKIFPLTLFKLVAGRIDFLSTVLYLLYALMVFLVIFLSFKAAKLHRLFLLNWAISPILIMMLVSLIFPQNQPFRVIYILPALILIFAQGCFRYPKLLITLFIYIAIVGNVMYFTRPRLQREQWRQAVNFLNIQASSSPVVVKFPGVLSPLKWYPINFSVYPVMTSKQMDFLTNPAVTQVFVLDYLTEITDPNRFVENNLTNLSFTQKKIFDFPGVGFIRQFNR